MISNLLKKINYLSYVRIEKFAGKDYPLEKRLHNSLVKSIMDLSHFMPKEHKSHNLERVIVSKAISYNTSLDKSIIQHMYLEKAISKLIRTHYLSKKFSGMIIDRKDKRLAKSMRLKTYEDEQVSFPIIEKSFANKPFEEGILFFASQPSHVKVFDSYFERSSITNYQLLLPYRLKDKLNLKWLNKDRVLFFEDFFQNDSKQDLATYSDQFQQIFSENLQEIKDLFHFNGKFFFNTHEPGLRNIFKYLLPQSLIYSIATEDLLKSLKINKIVGVRPRRIMDRALIQKAHSLHINTNLIIHSTLGSEQRELWSSGLFDNIDNIFGWGEKHSILMKQDSFSNLNSFKAVGSPLFNSPPEIKKLNLKDLNIIYASTRNDKAIIKSLEVYKTNNLDASITIKVHPGEAIPNYLKKELFKIEPGSFAIEDILTKYDIFITSYSGSHISAISVGLPVIFAPFYYEFSQDLETLYGINRVSMSYSYAENSSQLGVLLKKLSEDKVYREKLIAQQVKYYNKLVSAYSQQKSVSTIDEVLLS